MGVVAILSCDSAVEPVSQVPAALQILDGNEQDGTAGEELPEPLIVRVVNADGDPIQGQLVNFRITSGGGTVFAGSALTNSQGIVQERWTLGTDASQDQRVEARAVDSETGQAIVFGTFSAYAHPGPPAALLKIAGDEMELGAGSAVTPLPAVRVEDSYGNPVEGAPVTFLVTTGGASTNAGRAMSDAEGIARVAGWTISTTAGINTMTATVEGVSPVTFTITGVAGAPRRVVIVTEPSESAVVGVQFEQQPSVRLVDEHGNAVPQAGTLVTTEIATGGGTLTGTTTAQTDANGVGTFTNLAIVGTVGARTLLFRTAALEPATSRVIQVGAGTAATIAKHRGDGTSALAGTAVSLPPAVIVKDAGGNALSGVSVTFAVVQGGGSIEPATSTTGVDGIAALARWTLGATPGQNQVRATATGAGSVTFTATGTPFDGPRMLLHQGDDQQGIVDRVLPVAPTVRVVDAAGNGVAGVTVTFAVTSGGGSITNPTMTTGTDGLARVGQWRLGPIPGENTLTATASGFEPVVFSATARPDITITIHQPSSQLVFDLMPIEATVASPSEITSVGATIAGRSTSLTFNFTTRRWTGMIPLEGAPRGQQELVITATDVNGYSAVARKSLIHDAPPQLTVIAPLNETVARPAIRLQAVCDDAEGPCAHLSVVYEGGVLAEGTTVIDEVVDLGALNGRRITLKFMAEDASGRRVDQFRTIHVESSTRLREIAAAPGEIIDTDGARSLYVLPGATPQRKQLWILDHATGATTLVSNTTYGPAALTPRGALFPDGPELNDLTLYEFVDGAVISHGHFVSALRLLVEGRYAVWLGPGYMLYRRDIVAGVTTPIAASENGRFSIAANGDVAFWDRSSRQIHRYRDGQITRLTSDAELWNLEPVTDGINVVYKKTKPCCALPQQHWIAMHDGTREILLTEVFASPVPWPPNHYNANGGWVAFNRYGTSSVFATWIRTPSGEERLVTTDGGTIGMQALGPDGQVVVRNSLYTYPYTSAPLKYASAFGSTRFIGDKMYFVLGRHAFEVVR